MHARHVRSLLVVLGATVICSAAAAAAGDYSSWTPATRVEAAPGTDPSFNGPDLDGCPFISRDGRSFYMASNRPGGEGGLDIWVSTRVSENAPWGAPVNVGPPVNSAANDFCPTLDGNGHDFYFVSNREGGCGGADIYSTRVDSHLVFAQPENLGCDVNSAADEASPFPLNRLSGLILDLSSPSPRELDELLPFWLRDFSNSDLYFSSSRPGGFAPDAPGASLGDSDLYVSGARRGGFGPPELVPGVNTASEDAQPNLGRDGRELFFFSNRPGTLGMADIYSASRTHQWEIWSDPVNLGPNVNSAAGAETRPSVSWDGMTLYFGSNRPGGEGSTDHYVTTRERLN